MKPKASEIFEGENSSLRKTFDEAVREELTQEEKEAQLIQRVINLLYKFPVYSNWAYSSDLLYCIGLLDGFKQIKYKK
jgi:maltooligosyltrehalose synthase